MQWRLRHPRGVKALKQTWGGARGLPLLAGAEISTRTVVVRARACTGGREFAVGVIVPMGDEGTETDVGGQYKGWRIRCPAGRRS